MSHRPARISVALCLLGLISCTGKETPVASGTPDSSAQQQAAAPQLPPPVPKTWTIPVGAVIAVRTLDGMSTKYPKSGDEFDATLSEPLIVEGTTLAEVGSPVIGRVTGSDQGGRVKGKAMITLTLAQLTLRDGQAIRQQTNRVSRQARSDTKKNLARTGIKSGAGAAIGAITGGGKGAAIGVGVGAGAGIATNVATRGPAAAVPAEALLKFTLATPVKVTEKTN